MRRDGAEYEQSFKRGKPDGELKKIGAAASTGTTVTFKPDPEMFQETTLYRYETLLKRLREEAFLNSRCPHHPDGRAPRRRPPAGRAER